MLLNRYFRQLLTNFDAFADVGIEISVGKYLLSIKICLLDKYFSVNVCSQEINTYCGTLAKFKCYNVYYTISMALLIYPIVYLMRYRYFIEQYCR